MASRIQGITVEIGGDTTKLQTALKGVNGEIKNTQAQLKDVDKLLKMDPGNTDLLAQKQKLLSQAVGETKEKLETLKTAADQANTALENGDISQAQYDALQREIIETENELKELESQAEKSSVAMQKITQAGEKLKTVGDNISSVGTSMTKNVTGPIVAMGAAAVASFNEIDGGYDTIVTKTGATGEALESLTKSADNVFGTMPVDMSDVGIAIGEVNTRFGATGKTLEDLSSDFLKFAEINETDLNTAIGSTDKIMNQFGVDASQTKNVLGLLTAKAQETGISVDDLMNSVQKNGATFKSMGLNLGQSITLLAQFEQNGVNADTAMAGLKKAVANYTKQGMSMDEALGATIDSIKNASSETEALTIATEIFGTKGANEMTKAIREGRLSIDDLSGSMSSYGSTVDDTFNGTLDGVDNFKTAMNNAKLAMAELGEAISNVLGPILQSVSEKIRAFAQWFSGLSDGTKEFIVKLALIVAAVGPILVVIGKVVSAVGTIMTIVPKIAGVINTVKTAFAALNVTMLANPIVLIIAAIAALVAAFIYLWNNCDGFRQFWIDLWENVKQIAITVWTAISSFFSTIWEGIKTVFQTVVTAISTFLSTAWTAIQTTVTTVFTAISGFFSSIWNGIKTVFTTVITAIQTIITTYFEIYKTIITTVLTAIQTVFTTIWNAIKTVVTTVVTAISTFLTTAWNTIKTVVTTVLNAIKTVFTTVWNAIKTAVTTVTNAIKSVITSVWNGIKNTVTSVLNTIKNTVSSIFNSIKSAISSAMSNVVSTIKNGFNNAVGFIKGLASSAFSWGADIINGIVNGIKSCIGKIKDAVGNVADTIRSFLHFSVPDEGPLTDYESWMPDFMGGLAKGIEKSRGLIASAVDDVAGDMVINPNVSAGAIQTSQATQTDMLSNIMGSIQNLVSNMPVGSATSTISIPVYLGGTLIDEVVVNAQNRQNLRSGGR
ncbi:MAG: phage tail tape measure protein [Parabacteroides sp.]|nr:phage tail tape measure protein [Parabacteroides sp.]